MPDSTPFFSIVVPTRDRPELLGRALQSIAAQRCGDFEVLVVDDGSHAEAVTCMKELDWARDARFRFLWPENGEAARGPSASRNRGIAEARGRYIGFLDDDDYWLDEAHLQVAQGALRAQETDLYIADQVAMRGEETVVPCWMPPLRADAARSAPVHGGDVYSAARHCLLEPGGIGFAHVNVSLVRRELAQDLGGFCAQLPFEEDLDFYLRCIDRSQHVLYRAAVVSVNTLRSDASDRGASTLSEDTRQLYRMLACQHALLRCRSTDVRRYARLLVAGVLKNRAKREHRAGDHARAAEFAWQAVGYLPDIRWCAIAAWLSTRSCMASPLRTDLAR